MCPIDEGTAERLLAGLVAPDDAPPGQRALARAFDDARRPAEEDELAGRANIVAALAATLTTAPVTTGAAERDGYRARPG